MNYSPYLYPTLNTAKMSKIKNQIRPVVFDSTDNRRGGILAVNVSRAVSASKSEPDKPKLVW